MRLDIPESRLPDLERELPRLAPWMHPFQLGPSTFTGYFMSGSRDTTFCTSDATPDAVAAMRSAFDGYMSGRPYWAVDEALNRLGDVESALDIASATGKFSFALALDDRVSRVTGVEIRREQAMQALLLQDADVRLAKKSLEFQHEPVSADNDRFRDGESYDLVLSMGLLYHLENPLQHLRNLARLSRRAALIVTLTHWWRPGLWEFSFEDPDFITKATQGVSWVPHSADMPALLRSAGFDRVEILFNPELEGLQRPVLELSQGLRSGSRKDRIAARTRLRLHTRRLQASMPSLTRKNLAPGYFCYLAYR